MAFFTPIIRLFSAMIYLDVDVSENEVYTKRSRSWLIHPRLTQKLICFFLPTRVSEICW